MRAAQFVTKHPINVSEVCWKGVGEGCLSPSIMGMSCWLAWAFYILPVGTLQRGLWRDLLYSGPVGLLLCTLLFEVELNGNPFSCFKWSRIGRGVGAGLWPHMPVLKQWETCAWHLLINHMLYCLQMAKVLKEDAFRFYFVETDRLERLRTEWRKHT